MMKKKDDQSTQFIWMQKIQADESLLPILQESKKMLKAFDQAPALQLQIQDINANYQHLIEHPLTRIQTQRLFTHPLSHEERLIQFHQLWQNEIVLSAASWQHLAPHPQSLRIANANVVRYQKYLMQILFICLFISDEPLKPPHFLNLFLQMIHGIQQAYTTSKVTLRVEPNVKSHILSELPKHAQVEIFEEISPYWKKIRIMQDNQEVYGFVMSAYLKY